MPVSDNIPVLDLKDNQYNQAVNTPLSPEQWNLLEEYSGLTIAGFASKGITALFRETSDFNKDEAAENTPVYRLTKQDKSITTGNAMGIVQLHSGTCSLRLQIRSRFDQGAGQPFLLYLLSKVFGGVFLDSQIPSDDKAIWDILLALMFRQKFLEACAAGMFRQYRLERHNDMRYRGTFDMTRHLNTNIPFTGRIAYTTRSMDFDNPLNHLIRFALTKISKNWQWMITPDNDTYSYYQEIMQNTPSWNPNGLYSCIMNNQNRKPVRHPLYAQYYEPLRLLSLAILHEDGASPYDAQENDAQGFLFDGSWLWEEYIAALFNEKCKELGIHHQTTTERLFTKDDTKVGQGIKPDFIRKISGTKCASFIGDTKYKHFERKTGGEARNDYYQIITYMYRYSCKKGVLIFPYDGGDDKKEKFLDGYKREIDDDDTKRSYVIELGVEIPKDKPDFELFQKAMDDSENRFIENIKK
jgi:5-methylcytosine-specific restriction endonuclease McrBC regulatory subunit McrC